MLKIESIDIKSFIDERGQLSVLENSNLPFEIKRVYWMQGMNDKERGNHAHYKIKQCIVCIKGRCSMKFDDGREKKEVVLSSNGKGLIIEPYMWHLLYNFSPDCILMVLSSEEYLEEDYIRDYNKFKEVYLK